MLVAILMAKHFWALLPIESSAIIVPATTQSFENTENLFGQIDKSTSSTSLNGIRVVGLFAHPTSGFAVIQTNQGQIGVGIGDQVAPGVHLKEIYVDYVILDCNGIKNRVDMQRTYK